MARAGALLLCAGIGSRLAPVTNVLPKCLVPIAGQPLLAYWIELLAAQDVEPIVINVHHFKDQVLEFVEQSPFRSRIKVLEENILLGTGGTLKKAAPLFKDQPVLVAHADNLSFFSYEEFLDAYTRRPQGAVLTMMTFDTDAPKTCGIVETDSDGLVVRFHEKIANPPSSRANAAVYFAAPEFISFVKSQENEIVDLSTEILPLFMGKISVFHNSVYHRDIGTFLSWLRANVEAPLTSDFHKFLPVRHHFKFGSDVLNAVSKLISSRFREEKFL